MSALAVALLRPHLMPSPLAPCLDASTCRSRHSKRPQGTMWWIPTVLLAPARVLKRVAIPTCRFLGSTAPTASSGVFTTATNFGGVVRTAARPNQITKKPRPGPVDTGMLVLGDRLMGIIGEERPMLSDSLPFRLTPDVELPNDDFAPPAGEILRRGVASEDVERARVGEMPGRALGLITLGVRGNTGYERSTEDSAVGTGCADSPSSVHRR